MSNFALWLVLFLCIPLVTAGQLNGVILASLALITLSSFEAVTPLPLAAQMWISCREAARRLFEVVDLKPAVSEQAPTNKIITNYELQIKDLSFAYPNQSIPALRHITIKVKPESSIAIVGPSGAGKSTLANLLLQILGLRVGRNPFG